MNIERREPAPMTKEWGEQVARDVRQSELLLSLPDNLKLLLAIIDTTQKKLVPEKSLVTHNEIVDAIISVFDTILQTFPTLIFVFETTNYSSSAITLMEESNLPDDENMPKDDKVLENQRVQKTHRLAELQGYFRLLNNLFCLLAGNFTNTFMLPTEDIERIATSLSRLDKDHIAGSLTLLPEVTQVTVSQGRSHELFKILIQNPGPLRPIPHHG